MSRSQIPGSPFMLGFDQLERTLDQIAKTSGDGYPPYNIEQLDDERLRITLAVAGFRRADLSVVQDGAKLVIRGEAPEQPERVYLHRGIAARRFQRSYVLADGMEVQSASLEDGMLHVDLVRPKPQSTVQEIEIRIGPHR